MCEKLSRFTLGTVQLGMAYGINCVNGQPTEQQAFEILDEAVRGGVTMLDTANNYGRSEAIIGRWLAARRGGPVPRITTKIGPLDHGSAAALRDDVLRQTEASLEALGLSTLDVLMLHDYDDYVRSKDALDAIFQDMRAQGYFAASGISAYSHHDYGLIADSPLEMVQIPQNIFDWSQLESGGLQRLADAGKTVFVRSVFLQGLVFRTVESLDPRMAFCAPYLRRFHELCAHLDLTPAALALSFVLSLPGVASVVLGCDTPQQVGANCVQIAQARTLTQTQLTQIHVALGDVDRRVLDPSCWFNAFH